MPLYEFRCQKCETIFERLCRVGSNGKGLACPSCNSKRLRRLMSVFSTHVAGGSTSQALSGGSSCSGCSSHNCASCH